MNDSTLFARKKRSFKCTADSGTTKRIARNVLARSFTTAAPNRKWVTDVKAIRTGEGWMYLAAVIDLFS
jgi:putative transposase